MLPAVHPVTASVEEIGIDDAFSIHSAVGTVCIYIGIPAYNV